jgi:hypothetical protein
MCGIVGIINFDSCPVNRDILVKMRELIPELWGSDTSQAVIRRKAAVSQGESS